MHLPGVTLILTLALLAVPALADNQLVISDPWSPEAPPGRTMAGFMHLANEGSDAVVLVDATSQYFDRVEIHEMSMDEGVMRMRRLEALRIDPGQSVELRSGGYHLMLFGPRRSFQIDDAIPVELIGSHGQTWTVEFTVRARQPRS